MQIRRQARTDLAVQESLARINQSNAQIEWQDRKWPRVFLFAWLIVEAFLMVTTVLKILNLARQGSLQKDIRYATILFMGILIGHYGILPDTVVILLDSDKNDQDLLDQNCIFAVVQVFYYVLLEYDDDLPLRKDLQQYFLFNILLRLIIVFCYAATKLAHNLDRKPTHQLGPRLTIPEFIRNSSRYTTPIECQDGNKCSICLRDFKLGGEKITQLHCSTKHVFHTECILKWVRCDKSCPLCREPIQTKKYYAFKRGAIIVALTLALPIIYYLAF